MPIYEYICKACGCNFEKLVKSTSEDQPECPQCGSTEVKKEISMFSSGGSLSSSGPECFSGG